MVAKVLGSSKELTISDTNPKVTSEHIQNQLSLTLLMVNVTYKTVGTLKNTEVTTESNETQWDQTLQCAQSLEDNNHKNAH